MKRATVADDSSSSSNGLAGPERIRAYIAQRDHCLELYERTGKAGYHVFGEPGPGRYADWRAGRASGLASQRQEERRDEPAT